MRLRFASLSLSFSLVASLVAGCGAKATGGKPATGTAGATGAAGTGSATAGASGTAGATGTAGAGSGTAGAGTGAAGTTGAGGATGAAGAAGGATGAGGDPADAGAINDAAPDVDPLAGWTLSWSDEFNGVAGTKPDSKSWGYDLGNNGGWGVAQIQSYTSDAANASMDGKGNLAIVAVKDAQGNFTSARLKTQGKFEQAYGRFEMRAKISTGNGMWPAFWMLGNNFGPTPWPDCGEIDIMEVRGTQPLTNLGSLHGPGYSGMRPLTGRYSLPDGGAILSDDFHLYAIEWETNVVRFYVDSNLYETQTPANIPADAGATAHWVYDHPFFILLNLAVGGRFPGPPDGTTFPQTMLVDYIRVYKR